ncbi:MAG: radical SAM protein [Candidatus Methanofastidiosia archaeon]
MILHCMSPYAQHIPNPALGYLKGFLKAHAIEIKNVYWNLVLSREINNFNNLLKSLPQANELSVGAITTYTWKQLMGITIETPLDALFSSLFTKDEIDELINGIKDKIDWYIKQEKLHESNLAGFTMKTYQWLMNWYVMTRLKKMNPHIHIVAGGIANKEQGQAFMRMIPSIDFAIWGEGEYPLLHLVNSLGSVQDVPQLLYRKNTTICSTTHTVASPPLDEYPFADHTDYFDISPAGEVFIPVWGSRSCPWNKCKFCKLNEEYQYRTRSPENIVKEIEYQSQTHGVNNFIFVDTELPGNRTRFKKLLTLLVEASADRKEPYHFFAEVSPVFITDETAHLMEVASFTTIQMGFEAVTDSLLKKMEKRHRFVHNIQALKYGDQHNLHLDGLNIIRGIPTETKHDILESCKNLKFLRFLLNRYTLRLGSLELYKGSPFYEEMSEKEREPWRYHRFWEEISSTDTISKEDRFEFFGFYREKPHHVWDTFETVLSLYQQQNRSYTWIEYEDGSFIEEKGLDIYKYVLDRDETDLLLFCDSIRKFSEVLQRFSHIKEGALRELLINLKEYGLIYCDEDMREIISVVAACERKYAF